MYIACLQASVQQEAVAALIEKEGKAITDKIAGAHLLSVSVPVLSEQSTSMPDISSKQLNLHHRPLLEIESRHAPAASPVRTTCTNESAEATSMPINNMRPVQIDP